MLARPKEDSSTCDTLVPNSLQVFLLLSLRLPNVVILENRLLDHALLHQIFEELLRVVAILILGTHVIEPLFHSISFCETLLHK